jgi:integrase
MMKNTVPPSAASFKTTETPKSGRQLGLENLALGKIIHLRDGNVTLYKRPRSKQWQMRYRLYDKKWHRVTTGYEDLAYAKKRAGEIYDRARFMEELGIPIANKKFKSVALILVQELRKDLDQGTGKKVYVDYLAVLERYLIPFFGNHDITKIDHKLTADYESWRNHKMNKKPMTSTLLTHSVAFNRVFDLAVNKGWLSHRHIVPKLNTKGEKGKARPAFSRQEIDFLLGFMKTWAEGGKNKRAHDGRVLLRDYIEILLATGMRHGTESLNIKWCHIEWHTDKQNKYLRIWVDGKTGGRWLIAKHEAIVVLERIKNRFPDLAQYSLDEVIASKPNDYLWRYPNGQRPYDMVSTFKWLMKETGLLFDHTGNRRSMYSFRHTYATLALVERGMDIHLLAKQMGNSAAMIERHYSKLTPTMAADKLA